MGETFLTGVIAGAISVSVGAYRSFCRAVELETNTTFLCPPIWRSLIFQYFSLLVVIITSVWFALIFSEMISLYTQSENLSVFMFGILLVARWQVAGMIGLDAYRQKTKR